MYQRNVFSRHMFSGHDISLNENNREFLRPNHFFSLCSHVIDKQYNRTRHSVERAVVYVYVM